MGSVLQNLDLEVRDYQQTIVTRTLAMFAGRWTDRTGEVAPPARSVLVESPTGSGKTVMGLLVASVLQQVTGCRVGWVAMRRNLLSQAAAECERRGFPLEFTPISMFDRDPPACDLLVVDEAQHDAARSMADLHCKVRPRWTLGLSATPYRSDRLGLCFDRVVKEAGIARLIHDGILSPFHHHTLDRYTPESVADQLIERPERWGASLVFFHRHADCRALQARLQAAGVASDVVTAKSPRERQLAAFERGDLRVLINMAILVEGFDCPRLKTVFCRPSGKGPTIQMAGRVLRRHPDHTYKQIVQCGDTRFPFTRLAPAAEQYRLVDGIWKTVRSNRRLDAIARHTVRVLARGRVELPETVRLHRRRPTPWAARES